MKIWNERDRRRLHVILAEAQRLFIDKLVDVFGLSGLTIAQRLRLYDPRAEAIKASFRLHLGQNSVIQYDSRFRDVPRDLYVFPSWHTEKARMAYRARFKEDEPESVEEV